MGGHYSTHCECLLCAPGPGGRVLTKTGWALPAGSSSAWGAGERQQWVTTETTLPEAPWRNIGLGDTCRKRPGLRLGWGPDPLSRQPGCLPRSVWWPPWALPPPPLRPLPCSWGLRSQLASSWKLPLSPKLPILGSLSISRGRFVVFHIWEFFVSIFLHKECFL